ncbi:hypothetical protein JCM10908_006386 [Rhodotorula pacifica]|uniref:replication factor C subunit 1 n=1 Tax=Rhodotorula pacifica TaxID=1495444 RepID=UPI00316CEAC3
MPAPKIRDSSSEAEMEILSESKPKRASSSPRKRKVVASKEIVLSSSSSEEDQKPAKKKKKVVALKDEDDDDDEDEAPPKKKKATTTTAAKGKATATGAKKSATASKGKGKKIKDESSSEYDDGGAKSSSDDDDDGEEEEDVKPAKAKKPISKKPVASSSSTKAKASTSTSKAKPAVKAEEEEEEEKPAKPKWQYKPRAGPSAPGSKEIPVGNEGCLTGLTFVFTGELESLSREAGQDLVKRYGGRVTTAPSSKTSYVVLGSDAGPKKLELIKKHKLKTLDEDGFLGLIGNRKADPNDPKLLEAKKKEEAKVKEAAKALTLAKDAPEHLTQLWTTKYAPQRLTDICGNKGQVEKLKKWLESWPKSLACGFKKPGPDAMNTFRCVLISGPPGIGKTTAAHLVAKMLGYDVLELNASDTRSKRLLEEAFRSKVTDTTLSGFFKTTGDDANGGGGEDSGLGINSKSLIIMDEVDGMSAGDRGGIGALNSFLKKTKIPIIAIANDSKSQKMKPLINTTFQMLFKRPSAQEVRSRVMSIAFKEGLKLEQGTVDQLVAGSQSDIRQIINMLATYKLGAKAMNFDASKKLAKMNEKNTIQTPWTLYSKLFGPQAFSPVSGMTLNDKLEVYFQDHSIMPLFVQENYLRGRFQRATGETGPGLGLRNLELASKAAESISDGDLVDSMIHGTQQQWSLMPLHGMMSCVRPASFCYGQGGGYPNFPAWLGKNSTQGKLGRQLGEIQIRMRLRVSGDKREIRQSYIPTLFPRLVSPLVEHGSEGVQEVIELMNQYYLSKEEWDAIIEMGIGEGMSMEQVLKSIPTATKSAFTRKYNSSDHPIAYHKPDAGRAKAKKIAPQGEAPDLEEAFVDEDLAEADLDDGADAGSESDGPDSFAKDKMIKAKKPKAAGGAAAKGKAATTAKGKAAKK